MVGPATQQNARQLVSSALTWAAGEDDIPITVSPTTAYRKRKRTKRSAAAAQPRRRPTVPLNSFVAALRAIHKRRDRLFLLTILWAGGRMAEVSALPRVGAVDSRRSQIHATRTAEKGHDGRRSSRP